MGFRENLKNELLYSGMLVKELALRTGINKHTLDNYLSTHNCTPSAEAAVKIARALGVSVEYLVTGREGASGKSIESLKPETRRTIRLMESLSPRGHRTIAAIAGALVSLEEKEEGRGEG